MTSPGHARSSSPVSGPETPRRGPVTALATLLALVPLAGCATTGETTTDDTAMAEPAPDTRGPMPTTPHGMAAAFADRFVVTSDAASAIDYRILWQAPEIRGSAKKIVIADGMIFSLSSDNILSALDPTDGSILWRVPVAQSGELIHDVIHVPNIDRVYVETPVDVFELEATSGSLLARRPLDLIAATPGALYGDAIIYGATNGQLVWHAYRIGFQARAYSVARSIEVAPVVSGETVIAVGVGGRIMALDAAYGSQRWSKRLLDDVQAPPVVGPTEVYVAGLDQHLRAYDLNSGVGLWKFLTTAPLVDSPVLIGDRIYQRIPGAGLACFDALPLDEPGGRRLWINEAVDGNVLTRRGGELLVWNGSSRVMSILSARRGDVVERVPMPKVATMHASAREDGDLVAVDDAGNVMRLVPTY